MEYNYELATREARKSLIIAVYDNTCAWCKQRIVGRNFHAHHWLVKRGMANKRAKLLHTVLNVVPLHENCHATYGQTNEMYERCMEFVTSYFGSQIISDWLESLSKE